jgi:hypothetical protein
MSLQAHAAARPFALTQNTYFVVSMAFSKAIFSSSSILQNASKFTLSAKEMEVGTENYIKMIYKASDETWNKKCIEPEMIHTQAQTLWPDQLLIYIYIYIYIYIHDQLLKFHHLHTHTHSTQTHTS